MKIFEELMERGFIAQTTHEEEIKDLLNNKKCKFYIGFDATADSLHVGHFLQLIAMKHLQKAGHVPIALLGTGTTMIGDPTGRTDMRQMLDINTINENANRFKEQMSKFIDFSVDKSVPAFHTRILRKACRLDRIFHSFSVREFIIKNSHFA